MRGFNFSEAMKGFGLLSVFTDQMTTFTRAHFYQHGFTLITAWISNFTHYKARAE